MILSPLHVERSSSLLDLLARAPSHRKSCSSGVTRYAGETPIVGLQLDLISLLVQDCAYVAVAVRLQSAPWTVPNWSSRLVHPTMWHQDESGTRTKNDTFAVYWIQLNISHRRVADQSAYSMRPAVFDDGVASLSQDSG